MGRFAISARSKSAHASALNEEILIDKTTGQFIVKSPEADGGRIVSMDASILHHMHKESLNAFVVSNGMVGYMYSIPLTIQEQLPAVVQTDVNLLASPLNIELAEPTLTGLFESFIISTDAFTQDGTLEGSSFGEGPDPIITYDFEIKVVGSPDVISYQNVMQVLDSKVTIFRKSELQYTYGDIESVTLNSIKVSRPTLPTNNLNDKVILSGILVFIESEE